MISTTTELTEKKKKKHPNQWWVGFVCGMATFVDNAATAGIATALVLYQKGGITGNQVGMLTAALTIGVAVGSFLGGRLGDQFGRRRVFIATMLIIIIGAFAPFVSIKFAFMLPGVFLLGLGIGADLPVALATISETADDKSRGKILVFSNLLGGFGILMSVLLGIFFGNSGVFGGHMIFGAFGVVAVIVLLLRLTIPETDAWLKAREERQKGIRTERADKVHISDLLKEPYDKPFWTLIFYYGLAAMAVSVASSFGTYVAYNVAHISVSTFSTASLVSMPLAIVGAAWFMAVTDTKWRMPYYIVGSVLVVFANFIPVIFGFNLVSLCASTYLCTFAGAFCYETIMKVWTQESFPTMLRGTAQGTIYGVSRILTALLNTVTPALLVFNPKLLYSGVAIVAAVGFFIGWLGFHKDTRNTFHTEGELEERSDANAADVSPAVTVAVGQ